MDSNAKHMYEEVVRKDYEIIKHFLSKMSDVYNSNSLITQGRNNMKLI